jgi:glycosyltransferase involved in cell wall biosynthesis
MGELIDDGKNGFLVSHVDEAIRCVARIKEIDRASCRKTVEKRFTVDRMVERYLVVYKEVLKKAGDVPSPPV